MRWIASAASSFCLAAGFACAVSAQAQANAPATQGATHILLPPVPKPLLPDSFAGWAAAEPPKTVTDPAQADLANAAALKEYDFSDAAEASYKRSGETLSLRALRFHDASGAYGAYTYYRQDGWPREEIGSGAASNHNRVLFWLGNTVVDANFFSIGPMSAAELRELAGLLPASGGGSTLAPPILSNLPRTSLDARTTHYALGPASYAGSGGVLPPELAGFDRGAEAVTATYSLRSGPATLTIIDYPTPQMAAAQETRIRDYLKAGSPKPGDTSRPPWPKPLQDSTLASLEVRRSGPLVAIVSGDAVPDEAHRLLATVHFEADLTSIPQPGVSEVVKTGKLLLGIVVLVSVGFGSAVLLGVFLGGGRALYRIARGKPVSSVHDLEFISLGLSEVWIESPPAIDGPQPKS